MSRDDEGRDLARFLASGATEDAEALDNDVREAVFAIRPDLAPAPRVSAADILATVTRGPLAEEVDPTTPASLRSREGAEVVTFPGADEVPEPEAADASAPAEPDPVPRSRWWRWVGGTSGAGLLLAVAATLLLVTRPSVEQAITAPPVTKAAPAAAAEAEEAEPITPPPSADAEVRKQDLSPPPADPIAEPTRRPAERRTAYRDGPARQFEKAVETDLTAGGRVRSRSVRVPSSTTYDGDAVAQLEDLALEVDELNEAIPELSAGVAAEAKTESVTNLDALRGQADPSDRSKDAWRTGVTGDRLAKIDEAVARADQARLAGDRARAADELAALAGTPPAQTAQHFAALAAEDYYASQQAGRAVETLREALTLGQDNTPERSRVLYLLGLGLEAQGQPEAAADAFREAAEDNRKR